MVTIMYSSGLHIEEICHLRYKDVDRENMCLYISHGENRSAHYVILSEAASDLLTPYWFEYGRPIGYLFLKQHGGDKPIDTFFPPRHIHAYENRLGWEHRTTCHSFRHAFGTHLYEDGVDLLTIKAPTGHKSLMSTIIYVHLAANGTSFAVSPSDRLAGVCHE